MALITLFEATSANPRSGGFAEFAILEDDLAFHIPDAVSFDEAASMPLCSLTAAQVIILIFEFIITLMLC